MRKETGGRIEVFFIQFVSVTCFLSSLSLMKDYFFKPPINKLSLNFLEKSLESAYRKNYQQEVHRHTTKNSFMMFIMVHH